MTFDTVGTETPVSWAMSAIVVGAERLGRAGLGVVTGAV
jgi:hypothetical protein